MLYPVSPTVFIQTDNILSMTGTTITMNDAAVTTFTITTAQFKDIVAIVNDAFNA